MSVRPRTEARNGSDKGLRTYGKDEEGRMVYGIYVGSLSRVYREGGSSVDIEGLSITGRWDTVKDGANRAVHHGTGEGTDMHIKRCSRQGLQNIPCFIHSLRTDLLLI